MHCAAGPLVCGSPNETRVGHVAAGHCWWSHGRGVGARGYCCCSVPQRYLSSPQNLFMLPDPHARLPPEQKLEIRGVGSQRGCCSEFRASHGRTQLWWMQNRGLGRGEAAQPAVGAGVEEAGCVSPLQGEGSEITQAS